MKASEYTFPDEVKLVDHDPDTGVEKSHWSYAEILTVSQTETYAAMSVGLRPEARIILPSWDDDYHNEHRLEHKGIPYRIIRAYKSDFGVAELTVTRLKNMVSESDRGGLYEY